jgi:hypothetical protein
MADSLLPFAFHANALAVGGLFTAPTRQIISSEGSMALAPTGGGGSVTIENYNFNNLNLITCDRIITSVSGNLDDDGVYRTSASIQLNNFNAFGRISASLVQATVFSEHHHVANKRTAESEITFTAQFRGLSINGVAIEPVLDLDVFNQHATYDALHKHLEAVDARDPKRYLSTLGTTTTEALANARDNQVLRSSLVNDVSKECNAGMNGLQRDNFTVHVRGFGRVYLGEVLIKKGRRRLNMLRVELDPRVGVRQPEPQPDPLPIPEPGPRRRAAGTGDLTPLAPAMKELIADAIAADAAGAVAADSFAADAAAGGNEGSATFGTCETNGADFLP